MYGLHTRTFTHTPTRARMQTCAYTHMHAYPHADTSAHVHTYTRPTDTHMRTHACKHTYTHMHTHAHTHVYTHSHTYIRTMLRHTCTHAGTIHTRAHGAVRSPYTQAPRALTEPQMCLRRVVRASCQAHSMGAGGAWDALLQAVVSCGPVSSKEPSGATRSRVEVEPATENGPEPRPWKRQNRRRASELGRRSPAQGERKRGLQTRRAQR